MKLEPIDGNGAAILAPRDELARRRSNTAPKANPGISTDELAGGVTMERLQSLSVPVYAYSTQVTIHGIFPEFSGNVAGYKLLTRNGNGTLGVRYAGIDAEKKRTVADALRLGKSPWGAIRDSQGLTLQRRAESVSHARELIAGIPSGIYGNAGVFRCPMSGIIYAVVYVGAIRQDDLWEIIGYFAPGMTSEKIAEMQAEEERQRQERSKQYAIERSERVGKLRSELLAAREKALAAGYTQVMPGWKPEIGKPFMVLSAGFYGAEFKRKELVKRGPCLCVKGKDKARKVEKSTLAMWERLAKNGFIFNNEGRKA